MENRGLTRIKETQLAPIANEKSVAITNNPKLRAMANVIAVKINALLPYRLTDPVIEDWVLIIEELFPKVTVKMLDDIANSFLKGYSDWDKGEALQNITGNIQKKLDQMEREARSRAHFLEYERMEAEGMARVKAREESDKKQFKTTT